MNQRTTTCLIVFVFGVGWVFGAMQAPGARSPIGSPTQVPSSPVRSGTEVPSAYRTGPIPYQPNLYGYTGALIMTGNVGGGKHFRGFVPYGSSFYTGTSFNDVGSVSVSNFIRRSMGFEPYYDPSRTVSSLQRGTVSGLREPVVSPQGRSSTISTQWLNSFNVSELLRPPQQRPISAAAESIEAILDQQVSQERTKKVTSAKESIETHIPLDPSLLNPISEPLTPVEPLEPTEPIEIQENQVRREREPSIYQQMKEKLLELPPTNPEGITEKSDETAGQGEEETEPAKPQPPALGRARGLIRPEDVVNPALGRLALKDYEDYQQLAEAKSTGYMMAGEQFLKKGEYYKAADAFELAFLWDSKNGLLVLARSHALFAAGEYMSSAYYLNEALKMQPRLVDLKVDWGSLLNNRDDYENRLVELSTWQQRSNSAELAFLMGYVLYHDDKLTRARISAEYAQDTMPDNPAADVLVEAIEKALNQETIGSEDSGNP